MAPRAPRHVSWFGLAGRGFRARESHRATARAAAWAKVLVDGFSVFFGGFSVVVGGFSLVFGGFLVILFFNLGLEGFQGKKHVLKYNCLFCFFFSPWFGEPKSRKRDPLRLLKKG